MDTLPKELLDAINSTGNDKLSSKADLVNKNQDGLNTTRSYEPHTPARASSHQRSHRGSSQQNIQLPAEILLHILNLLSIPQLLPCQQVSRSFRAATRTVLMDRLGGGPSHLRQCPVCQPPYLFHQPLQQRAMSTSGIHVGSVSTLTERELARIGGGLSLSNNTSNSLGLPPLPQNHQSNLSHPQQQPVQQQHQLHHHLYQRQDPSDATHHQTDLHLHHPPLHNNNHGYLQRQQFHHDAGYVAPGTLALFLFPHHDHTPTGWQDRQAVHLHCAGVDRTREQLIFQPMVVSDREGAVLRFNTNSWNLPTFGALSPTPLAVSMSSTLSSSGSSSTSSTSRSMGAHSHSRSSSRGSTNSVGSSSSISSNASGSGRQSPATGTGLDLFDYTTGQSQRQQQHPSSSTASTGSLFSSSEQSSLDERTLLRHQASTVLHSRSPPLSSSPSSYSSLSSPSSSSSSSSSPTSINGNPGSTPSWATGNSAGGEHYSVIGVKHGDWPEDRQAAGRWWGGGLHSSITHESMVFLPWARAPGEDGSSTDHQQRMLRNEMEMEHVAPATRTLGRQYDKSTCAQRCQDGGAKGDENEENECSKVHVHKMYLSSSRAHRPPRHHHRFLCLHHDQLMADIASSDPFSVSGNVASSTAGSKHLAFEYGARVFESKRCLFCLSSPCKANLEIQVKFDQVRVSLDWILSGFVPEVDR
ncbi:MAG: hypothetical protein BYD32DRAFT_458563 [Podila humilis]|nr:MAG: hypothetical protein BYD32DRAFT_458563 [Podila humilis]